MTNNWRLNKLTNDNNITKFDKSLEILNRLINNLDGDPEYILERQMFINFLDILTQYAMVTTSLGICLDFIEYELGEENLQDFKMHFEQEILNYNQAVKFILE